VLTETIGHQQRRRTALAHQCRSCRQLWALRREPSADGWLIFCRYCGAPRAAQASEQALLQTTADVLDKADMNIPAGSSPLAHRERSPKGTLA
jgi:hypothetical protein